MIVNEMESYDIAIDDYVNGVSIKKIAATYEEYFVAYEFTTDIAGVYDPENYMRVLRGEVIKKIRECVVMYRAIKVYSILKVMYKKDGSMLDQMQYFVRNLNSGLVEFINEFG